MKNKYRRRIGQVMAAFLMVTMIGPSTVVAEETSVAIKREDIASRVVEYSPLLKGLELDQVQLSVQYNTVRERIDGLEMLYEQLETFQDLYNYYKSMSVNYQAWLVASAAALKDPTNPALALTVAEMTDGDYLAIVDPDDPDFGNTADGIDSNTLTGTEELTLKGEIDSGMMMGVDVYIGYTELASLFANIGITDPNLSKQEKYDIFIYQIEIVPDQLQNGVFQLGLAIEQAAAGLASGAESLYDATLLLEGYLSMQEMSYDMAVETLASTSKKYELGQVSEVAYKQAVNDEKIAKRQLDSMEREVDNLKMSMNAMLGQALGTDVTLATPIGFTETLEPLSFYINRGLEERAEILTNDHSTSQASSDLSVYKEYLGQTSIDYIRGNFESQDLALARAYLDKEIEAEIREAYGAVLEAEAYYQLSKLTMEDSLRQRDDMDVYVSLGFVTASTAEALDLLVTSSTNDYYKAYRDYLAAVRALESASTIG